MSKMEQSKFQVGDVIRDKGGDTGRVLAVGGGVLKVKWTSRGETVNTTNYSNCEFNLRTRDRPSQPERGNNPDRRTKTDLRDSLNTIEWELRERIDEFYEDDSAAARNTTDRLMKRLLDVLRLPMKTDATPEELTEFLSTL